MDNRVQKKERTPENYDLMGKRLQEKDPNDDCSSLMRMDIDDEVACSEFPLFHRLSSGYHSPILLDNVLKKNGHQTLKLQSQNLFFDNNDKIDDFNILNLDENVVLNDCNRRAGGVDRDFINHKTKKEDSNGVIYKNARKPLARHLRTDLIGSPIRDDDEFDNLMCSKKRTGGKSLFDPLPSRSKFSIIGTHLHNFNQETIWFCFFCCS